MIITYRLKNLKSFLQIFIPKLSRNEYRHKICIVACNKFHVNAFDIAGACAVMSRTVKMSVTARSYIIFVKDVHYFVTAVIAVNGRIMEEDHRTKTGIARRIERHFQPSAFAKKYVYLALGTVIRPAARAAYCDIAAGKGIVMQYAYREKSVFAKKGVHFFLCVPPVIVVALEYYLFSRKLFDKSEIANSVFKLHRPRNIAAYNDGVIVGNKPFPI